MHFEHILVTTDFSEDSTVAFDLAAYQTKMEGTRVTLLTVVTDWVVPSSLYEYIPDPVRIESYRDEVYKKAEERLKQTAQKAFHKQKVSTKVILTENPVAQEIVDYAKANKCDLIAIASHGKGTVGNLFLGSVVSKVIKLAECPVLVIPKKRTAASTSKIAKK